jgi:hypothetical protein
LIHVFHLQGNTPVACERHPADSERGHRWQPPRADAGCPSYRYWPLLIKDKVHIVRLQLQDQHVVVPRQRAETNGEYQACDLHAEYARTVTASEQRQDETDQEETRQYLAAEQHDPAEGTQEMKQYGFYCAHFLSLFPISLIHRNSRCLNDRTVGFFISLAHKEKFEACVKRRGNAFSWVSEIKKGRGYPPANTPAIY